MNAPARERTVLGLPLAKGGATLIEASAGTGKTYALTTLVARLLVEQGTEIGALLVVTFTNAATDELRDRIRHTLRAALRMATGQPGRQDAQAVELVAQWDALGVPRDDVAGRLEVAIADLDRANVLTIHGFCQRVLTDFAFECGLSFGFEVTGDGFDVVRAVVRDHWRRVLYPAPPVRVRRAMEAKFLPEELADWVAGKVAKRDLDIRGAERLDAAARARLEDREEAWRVAFEDTRAALAEAGREDADADLEQVGSMLEQAEGLLAGGRGEGLGAAELAAALDRRHAALRECLKRLDHAGAALREAYDDWLPRARREVLEEARAAIDRRVREDRLLGYDDLLTVVQGAVAASPELAAGIRERFPCALIDEYQDTDRVQADIFERVYGGDAGRLFVVGDPKQSIYRFRSADVFAYLKASAAIGPEERLRLGRNYRSVPELADAVNALFGRPRPFVLQDIGFEPVTSAYPPAAPRLVVEGEQEVAPLQFRVLPGQGRKKPTKGDATDTAAARAAAEIARLLALGAEDRARIGERPLTGGDIAVLVRKTDQGRVIAERLRGHGIRSVEIGDADVFESREAEQLERLLWAISKPQSPDRIRGALAADLFSMDAPELARLVDDDEAWNVWKERLEAWRGIWEARGVATAIRRLLWDFESVRDPVAREREGEPAPHGVARMLRHPEGARRLTNVMHLAELLQQAEADGRLSPTGLAAWFSRRRVNARRGDEVAQLRLESDEDLVKIVSIHRSKGLEFPIVFLPFAWDARTPAQNRRMDAVYHDRTEVGYPEVLDLNPDDAAFESEWLEDYSDEARLLYVALTRARLRCVVTWGAANQSEHAPLGWLLQPGPEKADGEERPESALTTAAAVSKGWRAPDWTSALERIAAQCPGAIAIETLSGAEAPEPVRPGAPAPVLRARRLERALRRTRQMTSYSALARGTGAATTTPDHETVEMPDYDGDDAPEADDEVEATQSDLREAPERTPFTFPSGPRAGNCLHRVFERLDAHGESREDLDALCRESLAAHGFGVEWAEVARTMVENTRRVRLRASAGPGAAAGFRLRDLARPIAEMEFHLPVQRLDRQRLGATLSAHGYGNPFAGAGPRLVEGFLRGFIDLVAVHEGCWYVVDYKSNLLGPSPDSYGAEGLDGAMARGGYRLQYLLYVLALHRYLSVRQPGYDYEEHVGGAFYLFLRGVDPQAGMDRGVYFDRPSAACIAALDGCFAGERQS